MTAPARAPGARRWAPLARTLALAPDEVLVCRARVPRALTPALLATLADDERARAASMIAPPARARFVAGRAALRRVLACVTGARPRDIRLEAGASGKPRIAGGGVEFNLAHAGDLVLVACARARRVGIDLERRDRSIDWEPIARRFLSRREHRAIRALSVRGRRPAFLAAWVRKEALAKGLGTGIATGFAGFDVSVAPHDPARILASRLADLVPAAWSLLDLDPDPAYVAAVAVEAPSVRVLARAASLARPPRPYSTSTTWTSAPGGGRSP